MANVVLTVHLLIALALIIVVLLQRSEGGGLGIGGGGGGGGVMSGRSAATALAKVTWILGTAFVVSSLALTIIGAQSISSNSVIDGLDPNAGSPASSSSPLGDDLLPPLADDGPAAPPVPE